MQVNLTQDSIRPVGAYRTREIGGSAISNRAFCCWKPSKFTTS